MVIPEKANKYDPRTNKQYEYTYTREEQMQLVQAAMEGRDKRAVMMEILSKHDNDWIEI